MLVTTRDTLMRGGYTLGYPDGSSERSPLIRVAGGMITGITDEIEYTDIPGNLSQEETEWLLYSRDEIFHVTIMPTSYGPVTVALEAGSVGRECDSIRHICNGYGDHLSNSVEHTVDGPRQLTVSDARAAEGTDSTMTFTVRLSGRATEQVTVTWQTQDMTALSTSDYEYDMGAVTFEPGETRKTITVGIRDDSLAEGNEQLRVVLRNADGAVIGDGLGIGTITDDE